MGEKVKNGEREVKMTVFMVMMLKWVNGLLNVFLKPTAKKGYLPF